MLSRWIRPRSRNLLLPLVRGLNRLHIQPAALTLAGLLGEIACGLLLARGEMAWALAALLLSQIFDSLDGELARALGGDSAFGGFLDSVCDHYGDLAVYLGLLWHFLALQTRVEPFLIAIALFGSVFGSHVRSRAAVAGVETRDVGALTRFERSLILGLGILLGQLGISLWALAILTNISALQRVIYTVSKARQHSDSSGG